MDGTKKGTTTPNQRGTQSNGNKEELDIPQT